MKSKSFLCACLAAVVTFSQSVLAGTFYPITVNYDPEYAEGDPEIADFPALLRIPENSPIYAVAGENGENLRFTDDTANYNCPHEIDTWNPDGVSLVWVKIPKLQNGAVVRLYYEGTNSTQVADVWSSYAGVWHLNEAVDSTGKDLDVDGTTHTTKFFDGSQAITDAPVGIGRGQPNQEVGATFTSKVATNNSGTGVPMSMISDATKVTFSCWARPTMAWTQWKTFIGPRAAHNGNLGVTVSGASSLRVETQSTGSAWNTYNLPTSGDKAFAVGSWTHFVFVFDMKSQHVYMNGDSIGSKTDLSGNPKWNYAGWMGWGGNVGEKGAISSAGAQAIDFDECRIYDGVETAKRIAADYATVADPGFLLIGGLQSESDYPEGTVAKVGDKIFEDLALAFSTAKADGEPVVLLANGLSWTFQNPGDSISIKLGNFSFEPINGAGAGYYLDIQYDSATDVTTYTVKKQIQVVAMRNVAVYKELHTRDLAELLPKQVAGLTEDGQIAGLFDVAWSINDITLYDHAGITPVPGIATVGGSTLPVTAYVRATLPYADGYHNIAGEATNMALTAFATITNKIDFLDDISKISENAPTRITNGLPATVQVDHWTDDTTGSFSTWRSGKEYPYLNVHFDWDEVKVIRRIEVIARTTNNKLLESISIAANGEVVANSLPAANAKGSEWINSQYNHRYDFPTPIVTSGLDIMMKHQTDHMDLSEILIWAEGGPVDRAEMSASADLVKLEFDGNPLPGFTPGTTFYQYPGAHEVTAWAGDPNAGVTVLPELDGLIRVVTLAEDAETTKTYLILRRGYTMLLLR